MNAKPTENKPLREILMESADSMAELKDDVSKIKTCLLGDEYNHNGLLDRVDCVERKSRKFEKYFWRFSGGLAVLLILLNILIPLLIKYFEK